MIDLAGAAAAPDRHGRLRADGAVDRDRRCSPRILLVSAEAYLATHTVGVFRLSFGGIGPTELRLLLAAGGFYVADHPWVDVAGCDVRLLDVSGLIAVRPG